MDIENMNHDQLMGYQVALNSIAVKLSLRMIKVDFLSAEYSELLKVRDDVEREADKTAQRLSTLHHISKELAG